MKIEALLFDLDGTLIGSERTHQRALLDAIKSQVVHIPEELLNSFTGISLRAAYDHLVEFCEMKLTFDELSAAKHKAYCQRRAELVPRKGAEALLAALQGDEYRFAVVSNSDRMMVNINLEIIKLNRPHLMSIS